MNWGAIWATSEIERPLPPGASSCIRSSVLREGTDPLLRALGFFVVIYVFIKTSQVYNQVVWGV